MELWTNSQAMFPAMNVRGIMVYRGKHGAGHPKHSALKDPCPMTGSLVRCVLISYLSTNVTIRSQKPHKEGKLFHCTIL